MTNGRMEESIKKEAVLSDVDPTTFGMLVEYAYRGRCSVISIPSTSSQRWPATVFRATILPTNFRCHICSQCVSRDHKNHSQYPFCSTHCRQKYCAMRAHMNTCNYIPGSVFMGYCESKHHNTPLFCVKDGSSFLYSRDAPDKVICSERHSTAEAKDYPPYRPELYYDADTSIRCTVAFSSRKYSCSKLSHENLRDLIRQSPANITQATAIDNPILQLAKLYVLAARYMVQDLPEICLHTLHARLLIFEISKSSINELIELILYTYENTSEVGSILDDTGDKLRNLVIRYAVDRAKDVMQYEEFRTQGMLGAGGAPSADFMAVTYGKTTS